MTCITNRSLISCIGSKIQFVCIKAFAFYRPSATYVATTIEITTTIEIIISIVVENEFQT